MAPGKDDVVLIARNKHGDLSAKHIESPQGLRSHRIAPKATPEERNDIWVFPTQRTTDNVLVICGHMQERERL